MASLTTLVSIAFGVFVLYSIWNLASIFTITKCKPGSTKCYEYSLNSAPLMTIVVFTMSTIDKIPKAVLIQENFNYTEPFAKELVVSTGQIRRNNGSLSIHTLILPTKSYSKRALIRDLVHQQDSTHIKHPLTKYMVPLRKSFNLLTSSGDEAYNERPVPHLKSKIYTIMCTDHLHIPHEGVPLDIIHYLHLNNRNKLVPIIEYDSVQMRRTDLVEIHRNDVDLMVEYFYKPVSIGRIRFLAHIEGVLREFVKYGFNDKDLDDVRGIFADVNMYLLYVTIIISSIHLLLDFLSFKNEISFWRANTSMAGLSTRGLMWRAFSQCVIFFYLLDEGTSLLVLVPSGVATLIELWKLSKVFKTTISLHSFKIERKHAETSDETETRKYDEECMKYLTYLLYPLCVATAIYSLIYQSHKSWYSWTINSLVNGVYAFGFLFMLPQLFINYRLKSVAALPWRAFTYKAFNTFIDDIFAFIITMPTAHRVACFRDDLVFLIYLYQRWLYPVDYSRKDDGSHIEKKTK